MKKFLPIMIVLLLMANTIATCAVFVDTTMVSANGTHKLRICIPSDYDANNKYELVLAIQPCNKTDYTSYVDALMPLTDSLNMIVACPDNSKTDGWNE